MRNRVHCGEEGTLWYIWRIYCTVKLRLYCGNLRILGRTEYTVEDSLYCGK